MEQRSSTVATMRPTKGLAGLNNRATELQASGGIGGGYAGPTLGVVPGRRLGRQATLAKGFHLMQPPAALPLFDMSVAVIDSLNLIRASMEEEVVLQSTLAVPAHQALACRIEAYGTPFSAPTLQAVVEKGLSEADKQFAACLAAPPDFDAIGDPSFSLQRMASISAMQRASPQFTSAARGAEQQAPQQQAGSEALRPGRPGELLRMPSIQSEKTDKKVQGWRKDLSNPGEGAAAADEGFGAGGGGVPSVSTPEGRAALAAMAAAAQRRHRWAPFEGCTDIVAALVGTGYLLMRAARFSQRAPRVLDRLSTGLRRMSSVASPRGWQQAVAGA